MTTNLLTNDTHALICKHLRQLPPVVSDWQQSCLQPRCSYYRQGECCNPARRTAVALCPFDGKELLLEDTEPAYAHIMPTLANPTLLQPVNRFIVRLSRPAEQSSRPVRAQTVAKNLQGHPEEPAFGAVLTCLIGVALAPFVVVLWPAVFALLVLFFVALGPIVAIGMGVQAILRHGCRVGGAPVEHFGLHG